MIFIFSKVQLFKGCNIEEDCCCVFSCNLVSGAIMIVRSDVAKMNEVVAMYPLRSFRKCIEMIKEEHCASSSLWLCILRAIRRSDVLPNNAVAMMRTRGQNKIYRFHFRICPFFFSSTTSYRKDQNRSLSLSLCLSLLTYTIVVNSNRVAKYLPALLCISR